MDAFSGTGLLGHYIFISTDSVYMCCLPPAKIGQLPGIQERHAVRPSSKEEFAALQGRDSYQIDYGGGKLGCEEVLLLPGHCFFLIRRLPHALLALEMIVGIQTQSSFLASFLDTWLFFCYAFDVSRNIGSGKGMEREAISLHSPATM